MGAASLRAVVVEARAKLNLGLAVGPRRPDGYHEVATVYQSISLADTLVVEPRPRGYRLILREEDVARRGRFTRARLPAGPDNLVLRAARLIHEFLGWTGGACFTLTKRIPVGAGLGGGSADAAAAVAGLLRLRRVRLDRDRRLRLAAALGSDVPFAMVGGTALGLGRGERLVPLRPARPFHVVVAMPRWRVSTALAYRRIDRLRNGLTGWQSKLLSVQAVEGDEVTASTANRLGNIFERVLGDRRLQFESLRKRLQAAGVEVPHLTGSGAAVFGSPREGVQMATVMERFEGDERLFAAASRRKGLRIRVVP